MGRKNKLKRFSEMLTMRNVYQCFDAGSAQILGAGGVPIDLVGHWAERAFQNDHPITLELACGKGEYTLGLAALHPDNNYIGVDIKGARMWKGAHRALEHNMQNVAFLRCRIELLDRFFTSGELSGIWITFADPQPSKENKRLTAPRFLDRYAGLLQPGAPLILKTDDEGLYRYSLESISSHPEYTIEYHAEDLYAEPDRQPEDEIITYYESQHLAAGKTSKMIRARRL